MSDTPGVGPADVVDSIRPYLAELLRPDIARDVDMRLTECLRRAANGAEPAAVERELRGILGAYPGTREWIEEYSRTGVPPQRRTMSGSDRPPGGVSVPPPPRFRCPFCSYEWHRLDPDDVVEQCPEHLVPLVYDGTDG
jgi:hypothetical protein